MISGGQKRFSPDGERYLGKIKKIVNDIQKIMVFPFRDNVTVRGIRGNGSLMKENCETK